MTFPKNWEGTELMYILSMSPVPTKANNKSIPGKGFKLTAKTNRTNLRDTFTCMTYAVP